MPVKIGSTWNKWDLHIHTPMSIEQSYGGDTEEVWNKFIKELSELDEQVKAIGISDYWFIDGYKRVLQAKNDGKLPNIEKIFPLIEIRVDKFGTTKDSLSRVNMHFLLNPDEDIDRLYASLAQILKCHHEGGTVDFKSTISLDAIDNLGEQLLAQNERIGLKTNDSARQMGFANFQAQFSEIREGLAVYEYLRKNVLVFMGRREWEDIKWGGAATAEKHSLMAFADGVFTASPTREEAEKCVESLRKSGVTHRVLHASDAHEWCTIPTSPRKLGHHFTWINSDISFAGLRHALTEYDSRVSFENLPKGLGRCIDQPETILQNVSINSNEATHDLFDLDIPLNSGFIVVIGNKGQGKSALLDSIAFGAHSGRQDDYSFLRNDRFLGDSNASKYQVKLTWADGQSSLRNMGDSPDAGEAARAEYLPQQLVERICSADPKTMKGAQLENEIERVIFQHIPSELRSGARDFSELRDAKLSYIHEDAREARMILRREIESWVSSITERDVLHSKKLEEGKVRIERQIQEKTDELQTLTESMQNSPTSKMVAEAREKRARLEKIEGLISSRVDIAASRLQQVEEAYSEVQESMIELQTLVAAVNEENNNLKTSKYVTGDLAKAYFYEQVKNRSNKLLEDDLAEARDWHGAWSEALLSTRLMLEKVQRIIDENSVNLDERTAEGLRKQLAELTRGDGVNGPSLASVEAQLARLTTLEDQVRCSWDAIKVQFEKIHGFIVDELTTKESLYLYASDELKKLTSENSISMDFKVDSHISDFKNCWVDFVNKQKLGALEDLSDSNFDEKFFGTIDLSNSEEVWSKVSGLIAALEKERADDDGDYRGLALILRSGKSVQDLVENILGLKWLVTRYRISAVGRDLNQLSPGQRGLVLLLFYLLLDRQNKPLLLDQPEENLDNESIKQMLLPAIRNAAKNRQIIAVTHNANLAVVGDADQVIHAKQSSEGVFTYSAGSLVDFDLGQPIVDVLEGSHSAFQNRGSKYDKMVL